MKECLHCKNRYESSKDFSKFCSTKCRVAYNRKNPKQSLNKVQVQVLYNAIMERLGQIEYKPTTGASFDGKKNIPNDDPLTFQAPKIALKSFDYYRMAKKELNDEEDWLKMKIEIQKATHLTEKQKNLLLTTNL